MEQNPLQLAPNVNLLPNSDQMVNSNVTLNTTNTESYLNANPMRTVEQNANSNVTLSTANNHTESDFVLPGTSNNNIMVTNFASLPNARYQNFPTQSGDYGRTRRTNQFDNRRVGLDLDSSLTQVTNAMDKIDKFSPQNVLEAIELLAKRIIWMDNRVGKMSQKKLDAFAQQCPKCFELLKINCELKIENIVEIFKHFESIVTSSKCGPDTIKLLNRINTFKCKQLPGGRYFDQYRTNSDEDNDDSGDEESTDTDSEADQKVDYVYDHFGTNGLILNREKSSSHKISVTESQTTNSFKSIREDSGEYHKPLPVENANSTMNTVIQQSKLVNIEPRPINSFKDRLSKKHRTTDSNIQGVSSEVSSELNEHNEAIQRKQSEYENLLKLCENRRLEAQQLSIQILEQSKKKDYSKITRAIQTPEQHHVGMNHSQERVFDHQAASYATKHNVFQKPQGSDKLFYNLSNESELNVTPTLNRHDNLPQIQINRESNDIKSNSLTTVNGLTTDAEFIRAYNHAMYDLQADKASCEVKLTEITRRLDELMSSGPPAYLPVNVRPILHNFAVSKPISYEKDTANESSLNHVTFEKPVKSKDKAKRTMKFNDGCSTTEWEQDDYSDQETSIFDEYEIPTSLNNQRIIVAQQPSFDQIKSKQDDIYDWFKRFEKISKANGWSLDMMATQAPLNFHGAAESVWEQLPANKKKDYHAMRKHMLKHMRQPGEESKNILEYHSINQLVGESSTEFANRLKKLLDKTPSLKQSQRDTQIARHFVRRSRPEIRAILSNTPFENINQAVKQAERIDGCIDKNNSDLFVSAVERNQVRFRENKSPSNQRYYSPEFSHQNVNNQQRYRNYKCLNCGSDTHLVSRCPKVDRTTTCSYCKKLGHHQGICLSKYIAETRNNQYSGNAQASRPETTRIEANQSPEKAI